MDCLDRTNVVQSVFSGLITDKQLKMLGLKGKALGKAFEPFTDPKLEHIFRNSWADNADSMSILYTGTPALKTDFTRTGKRSSAGALQDGRNSMVRYFINNFQDGYNHNCLDLALGKLDATARLNNREAVNYLRTAIVMTFWGVYFALSTLKGLFPYPDESLKETDPNYSSKSWNVWILHTIFTVGLTAFGMLLIQYNGDKFVDLPTRHL